MVFTTEHAACIKLCRCPDSQGSGAGMEKNRLEAFSDGVLAIIITIMVLELRLPAGDTIEDLMELTPTILSYLLSFAFVAIYWVNHHMIMHDAERVNVGILWCNIVWLLALSFIPFTTAWVGSYPMSWAPVSLYFMDMFLAAVTFHLMYFLIISEAGVRNEFSLSLRSDISMLVYLLAAVLGGFYPPVAYVAVALVTCWWIIPEKTISEKLTQSSRSS